MGDVKSKFTLHPQHKNFALGESEIDIQTLSPHLTSMRGCFTALMGAVFMLLISLCLVTTVVSDVMTDQRYAREGKEATAIVMACEFEPKMSRLTYTYTVGETSYTHVEYVDHRICYELAIGTAIHIVYLMSEPATARHIDRDNFPVNTIFLMLFICCLVIPFQCIRLMRRYLYGRYTRRTLAAAYHLLEGEITAINGYNPYKHDAYYVRVWYTFEAPRKKVLKGYAEAHRQDLKGQDLPPVGTPITVLYADNGSHMML